MYLSRQLFTDSLSKSQPSRKIGILKYGPFKIISLVGKNAVCVKLPSTIHINPVVHVEPTSLARCQPDDISYSKPPAAVPFQDQHGGTVVEVAEILFHRQRGKGLQFLTLNKNFPIHEAEWKPTRDYVDKDGTITAALHSYIIQHNLLPQLH